MVPHLCIYFLLMLSNVFEQKVWCPHHPQPVDQSLLTHWKSVAHCYQALSSTPAVLFCLYKATSVSVRIGEVSCSTMIPEHVQVFYHAKEPIVYSEPVGCSWCVQSAPLALRRHYKCRYLSRALGCTLRDYLVIWEMCVYRCPGSSNAMWTYKFMPNDWYRQIQTHPNTMAA